MNNLTRIPSQAQSDGYSQGSLTVELAKALALVAPITMSSDQQEMWLRAAIDTLQDIRPEELAAVSLQVRRSVTRPSQIVPEIARLVAERRASRARINELIAIPGPAQRKPVMDRRGEPMSEEDTAELNRILEASGATARYRPDGSRYFIEASPQAAGGRG
jgi:hypothetical protein